MGSARNYFTLAGTGMTYLPSFSATKFSFELDELPLASFDSIVIFNFFVGLSGSCALIRPGQFGPPKLSSHLPE